MSRTLTELAELTGARLVGEGAIVISRVASLDAAGAGEIGFLASARYRAALVATGASAVVLGEESLGDCPAAALVTGEPYLAFARIAAALHPPQAPVAGIHPSACIDVGARVDASAAVGPGAIIAAGVVIGPRVLVGAGVVIGEHVRIGEDTRLFANVTIERDCIIGRRVTVQPGAVIGADGFGFANASGSWVRMPQLGRVVIGDDVDIGANTTIDRGTLGDTVIESGVKLDNLIQVAHNVRIGRDSAAAACVGISGSVTIGARCLLAGGVGVAGHLSIGDDVTVTGMSMVTHSLDGPGRYSSGLGARPNSEWNRTVARIHGLDRLARRVEALERGED